MRHAAPFYSRAARHNCSIDRSMVVFWRILWRGVLSAAVLGTLAAPAGAASVLEKADSKLRYEDCLSLANLNQSAALGVAAEWSKAKGGAPADHCLAMALVELKRYPEAATRLD